MLSQPTSYELVLPRAAWERALRELLVHPDRVAVGNCRRNEHDGVLELLAEDFDIATELPAGDQKPPLGDWLVLGVPTGRPGQDPQVWIRHLRPKPTQLLVIALVGLGLDRSSWDGVIVHNGRSRPLDAIRIIGPGMIDARRARMTEWSELDADELQRWSRTRGALGEEVWAKVSRSNVLLFGAGRNGSGMAYQLVALGIRSLTIVDPDRVGIENLDACYTYGEADIGRPKAEALQDRLLAFRSNCAITRIPHSVTHADVVRKARGADVIVSCVDHDTPRLAAALLAQRFLKVHLDVGTGVTIDQGGERLLAGDIRLLLPGQGCVCCVGGLSNEEEARIELLTPPSAVKPVPERPWHEHRAGSLITLNSLAVSTGVQLWLDLLAGKLRTSHWHRLRWQSGGGIQSHYAPVEASAECRICGNGA